MIPVAAAAGALVVAIGAIAATAARRPALALGLATALLVVPAICDGPALVRFLLGLFSALVFIRTVDLLRIPMPELRRRLFHLTAVFDTRGITQGSRVVDAGLLLKALPWGAAVPLSFYLGTSIANAHQGALHWGLRWAASALLMISAFELLTALMPFCWGLAGVRVPVMHDAPYLSTSIREFWGTRWNKVVSRWLRENVFLVTRPRVGTALALGSAFLASAVLHLYLAAVGLGFPLALWVAAFFVVQVVGLSLEGVLRVGKWPVLAARAWTWGAMLLPAPLFLEPVARILEW